MVCIFNQMTAAINSNESLFLLFAADYGVQFLYVLFWGAAVMVTLYVVSKCFVGKQITITGNVLMKHKSTKQNYSILP